MAKRGRVLIEAAWSYRMQARVSRCLLNRLEGLPKEVRDIAWKAQVRLFRPQPAPASRGKTANVVMAATARVMLGFAWAIAREVAPYKSA